MNIFSAIWKLYDDMMERDANFRHDRAMERYARGHPEVKLVEFDGRLWTRPRGPSMAEELAQSLRDIPLTSGLSLGDFAQRFAADNPGRRISLRGNPTYHFSDGSSLELEFVGTAVVVKSIKTETWGR